MGRRPVLRFLVAALVVAAIAGVAPTLPDAARAGTSATFLVELSGNGSGSVAGPDGTCSWNGSSQSGDCAATEPVGPGQPPLVYTATPAADSTVTWTAGCTEAVGNSCFVDRTAVEGEIVTIKAAFSKGSYPLTVTPAPGGTVMGQGINCGAGGDDCSEDVPAGTTIQLTATPMAGYAFNGWEGACAATATTVCQLPVSGPTSVGARFAQGAQVTVTPPVGGKVVSSPTGVDCGLEATACVVSFAAGTDVQLTAQPMVGYRFARWEGACADVTVAACTIRIGQNVTISVVFVKITPKCRCRSLTVEATRIGSAQGTFQGRTLTRFFVTLRWTLACTAGEGQKCKGNFTFKKPSGFTIVRMRPNQNPVKCEGSCKTDQSTLTRGTVRISMNSPQTLAQLAGKRFTFRVITRCSGKKATTTYSVKINDRGRIDRRGSDLDGDGRPDGS